jgi:hypothetical protein
MFCSGCGHVVEPGQPVCPQCGRPMMAPPPPQVPNLAFEVGNYANRVRVLSTVWFIYGGLVLVTGVAGLTFAREFFNNGFSPWMRGPWSHGNMPFGPGFGSAILHFAWVMLTVRAALAFIAGWGLMERAPWGRVVAIVAAFFCLLKIPFGTAIGIWTLVSLLGYRNATLYDQL